MFTQETLEVQKRKEIKTEETGQSSEAAAGAQAQGTVAALLAFAQDGAHNYLFWPQGTIEWAVIVELMLENDR